MNYKQIFLDYVAKHHKNLNQFCKEYKLSYGSLHRDLNKPEDLGLKRAKTIEDLIYQRIGIRIFSNDEQIPIQCIEFINLPDRYILDPHVLAAVGTTKDNLKIFKLSDLSMSPIFHKDTLILVNTSDKEITPGKFYAIEINGEVAIRRLVKSIGSDIYTAKPENINFESQFFNPKQDKLIGRCVHICGQNI